MEKRRFPLWLKLSLIFWRLVTGIGTVVFVMLTFVLLSIFYAANPQNIGSYHKYANGIITEKERTNSRLGLHGIYAYNYKFITLRQEHFVGKSFSEVHKNLGDTVNVKYSVRNPTKSCIEGMRSWELKRWILLAFLPLTLIPLCYVFFCIYRSTQDLKLLENGLSTQAKFTERKETGVPGFGKKVYKMWFRFVAADGKTYFAICKTRDFQLFDGEASKRVVYDPRNPERNMLVSSLPPRFLYSFLKLQ